MRGVFPPFFLCVCVCSSVIFQKRLFLSHHEGFFGGKEGGHRGI